MDVPNPVEYLSNDMANRMCLFYANATPMLRVLSDATSRFVKEVSFRLPTYTDVLISLFSLRGYSESLKSIVANNSSSMVKEGKKKI